MVDTQRELAEYIRADAFPTPFCPGCGHGILMNAIVHAMRDMNWDPNKCVFVSGIGCAAWIPSPHFATDTLHTTHGRATAFATGIALYRPDLKVVVVSGDGDLSSIGGNHLIHAARRNFPMTVICATNNVFGMTGGQMAPTSYCGLRTPTTPKGNVEKPFDLCNLMIGAGADFVARQSVVYYPQLLRTLKNALTFEGFSFVDAICACPTHFGKDVGAPEPWDLFQRLRKACRHGSAEDLLTKQIQDDEIYLGEFRREKKEVVPPAETACKP
jgi:2-oxoglutarate ferredoxin oxidoreductase subunit beta